MQLKAWMSPAQPSLIHLRSQLFGLFPLAQTMGVEGEFCPESVDHPCGANQDQIQCFVFLHIGWLNIWNINYTSITYNCGHTCQSERATCLRAAPPPGTRAVGATAQTDPSSTGGEARPLALQSLVEKINQTKKKTLTESLQRERKTYSYS